MKMSLKNSKLKCRLSSMMMVVLLAFQSITKVVGLGVQKQTRFSAISDEKNIDGIHSFEISRRSYGCKITSFLAGAGLLGSQFVSVANANENDDMLPRPKKSPRKPFAPGPALLPPARLKLTIDTSVLLVDELLELGTETSAFKEEKRRLILDELAHKILDTKTFMVPLKTTSEKTISSAPSNESLKLKSNTKLYDETYSEKLKNVAPTEVPLALMTKAGDYRQFDLLQKRQRKLEKMSPIREAFNYYTRQLQFDTEYYVLNVDLEERKRMIRNDVLPDIKSVIVADLDLRDLVRNQVLDAVDDLKAELEYQRKIYETNPSEFDANELRTQALRAKKECDQWFSFIPEGDVEDAMATVEKE